MLAEWLEDAARHQGSAHAVVQRETYLSFRGLLHRAARRTQELRALGVEPGTGVGILLGNVADVVVFAVALNQLGASVVPLHPLTSARELAHISTVLPLRAIVSRPGLRALDPEGPWSPNTPPPLAPTMRTRLQGSLLSCALFRLEEAPPLPPNAALVYMRPGAQGQYSAVVRSGETLAREAEHLWTALDTGDRPRIGAALPIFQPFTLELLLTFICGYGAEVHLDDDLTPRRILGRLRDAHPTLAPVTRALLRTLVGLTAPRALDPTLRLLCVDGPVERDLEQALRKTYGLRPLGMLHRMEAGLLALETTGSAPHTLGPPIPGVDVRMVGARGTPVTNTRRGNLQVRLPAEQAAGMGAPAGASPAEGDGLWVNTGDLASQDSKGRIRLHGRTDDQVLVGGMPVSLEEVREVLTSHPSVAEAEISLPEGDAPASLDGAALLKARVVRREGVSVDTLLAHLGRHLSPYKAPGTIQFVSTLNRVAGG